METSNKVNPYLKGGLYPIAKTKISAAWIGSRADRLRPNQITVAVEVVSKPRIPFESPAEQKRDFTS
jgi:hypothetical protein